MYAKSDEPDAAQVDRYLWAALPGQLEPYYLCCSTSYMDWVRRPFTKVAHDESLPRPTVVITGLGAFSWYKEFNVVDFAKLGSPVIAKSGGVHFRHLNSYFFDFAAPDMIVLRGRAACNYADVILLHPRFEAAYSPVRTGVSGWTEENCRRHPQLVSGEWVRKDILKDSGSAERRLIEDLRPSLSTDRLRRELEACQADPEWSCVYVARTAYRFLPEFREQGAVGELNAIFLDSRTREFDLYLIDGYRAGQAHERAVEFIASYHRKE